MKTKKRLMLILAIMMILTTIMPAASVLAADNDVVPDMNLRAAINKKLGEADLGAPISKAQMESLTGKLSAGDEEIVNLKGMEYATNLTELSLGKNNISNIEPLRGLTKLTFLYLPSNKISNIEPLKDLTNLTWLDFTYNKISNIEPLKGLTNLTSLHLYSNNISNIESLQGLTNLTYLNLVYNNISNIEPLKDLKNLTNLQLYFNNISNIEPLKDLTNLTKLELWRNNISNIEPLRGLNNLTTLYLDGNNIADFSPIQEVVSDIAEEKLNLSDQKIYINTDVETIANPLIKTDGIKYDTNWHGDGDPLDNITIPEFSAIAIGGENIATYADGKLFVIKIGSEKATVSFDPNGGTGSMSDVETPKKGYYTLPENGFTPPTEQEFKAWEVDGEEKQPGETIIVSADTTVKTLWIEKVTISFSANGGFGNMDDVKVDKNSTFILPENTFTPPPGKEFKAWLVGDDEKQVGDEITITEDILIISRWKDKEIAEQVTVSFDPNGGTGTMVPVKVEKGAEYTLPSNTFAPPENKEFKAWEVAGTEKQPGDTITVSADTTVKAIWKDKEAAEVTSVQIMPQQSTVQKGKEKQYTVNVGGNGSYSTEVDWEVIGGVSGTTIDTTGKLKVAEDETTPTLTVKATSKMTNTVSDSVTVKISEEEVTPHTLTIIDTSGTKTSKIEEGEAVALIAEGKPGHKFVKWETEPDGVIGNPAQEENGFIMPAYDVKVTAIYQLEGSAVDKSSLQTAITTAENEITNTKTSPDGNDVPKNEDWVIQEVKNALQTAINDAKTILNKTSATQAEVDNAVTELNNAITTFQNKKTKGLKDEIKPPVPSTPWPLIDPSFIMWGAGNYPAKPTTPTPVATTINLQTKLVIGNKVLEKDINGATTTIEMDVAPYIVEGRTMVPIRFVAESLGFNVEWNQDTWTVKLTDKNNTVEIPVLTKQIIVNGNVYESDVAPILENGRTFLPIGNVARALGLKDGTDVIWNELTKEVIIKRTIEVK